jgi:predicted permease
MTANMHEFLGRLKSLFRKRRMNQDMVDELAFHQSLMRDKLLAEGLSASEADAIVRRSFGNPNRWHERLRELWQFRDLENLRRDLVYSARMLRKSPGFTSIALLTLALGVGANAAVFSLIDTLLLRPLPVPHSEELAIFSFSYDGSNGQPEYDFSMPFFRGIESHSLKSGDNQFANVFAFTGSNMQVKSGQGNENVPGQLVSGQFFEALQTPPLLGRYLTPQDDIPGGSPQGFGVVISESFWQTWFNRAPDVVGRKLVIAGAPFTVVGVMPSNFVGADPTQRPKIFAPLYADPIINAPHNHIEDGMHAWWLTVAGRMNPGGTLAHTNAVLETISLPIFREATDEAAQISQAEKMHFRFFAESGSRGFTAARFLFRKPLQVMFAMCIGILILACLNLASLLMARAAARERELATRLAIGATRKRLIQQLLVESGLIAVLGTITGLAAVPLVSNALRAMQISDHNGNDHVMLDMSLDWRVFAFTATIAVLSTLLIGLLPALQATSGDLNQQIKNGQYAIKTQDRRRLLPRVLMSVQVALALILVVGAGLLATSLIRLFNSGVGFDPHNLASISFRMDKQQLEDDALIRVYQQIGEGLRHQPGVKAVSFQFIVPLSHLGWNGSYKTPGGKPQMLWLNGVGPAYFETMHIPMYGGREFTWSDTKASGMKMILNRSAAQLLFPDQNAIGRQVIEDHDNVAYEVVAVVGDAKYRDVRTPAPPAAYVPLGQGNEKKPSLSAIVRYEGSVAPLASAARSLASNLAPTIPAPVMITVDEMLENSLFSERMMAILAVFFAGCALLVTAIGLYGTLSYNTARRTSEIGIRMALGARRAGVVALVFRENAVIAIAGTFAGLIAAILTSKVLATFLYETSPRDPWILLVSVATLGIIASAASLVPAIMAARIEPIAAIRCE